MSDIAESAIQAALVDRLTKPDLGWRFVAGGALDRTTDASSSSRRWSPRSGA